MTKQRDIFIRNARINKGKENRGYYENFSDEIEEQMERRERELLLEEFEERQLEEEIEKEKELMAESRKEEQENYIDEYPEWDYENEVSSSDYSTSTDEDLVINDIIRHKIEKFDKNQTKYPI